MRYDIYIYIYVIRRLKVKGFEANRRYTPGVFTNKQLKVASQAGLDTGEQWV